MIDEIYGRLRVVKRASNTKDGKARWLCECKCGNKKAVLRYDLVSGKVKSCGCLRIETAIKTAKKRAIKLKYYKQIRNSWDSMNSRCYNKNNIAYKNYGGRGIAVCEQWADIETFYAWAIKNGFKPGLTLDRISVDGNYEPNNCRWATMEVQQNNRRNNHKIYYRGRLLTLSRVSKIVGISSATLAWRIKNNWEYEDLFIKPSYSNSRRKRA